MMNLNRAKTMFGEMGKVEVSTRREDLKPGEVQLFIGSVKMLETREFKPYVRISATVLCCKRDGSGRTPDAENFEGNSKGEEVSVCLFSGDYFQKEFKSFMLAGLGMTKEDAAGMDDAEFFEASMAICGMNDKGEDVEAGIFDGTTIITTTTKANVVPDKTDPSKLKTYLNHRFVGKVEAAEVAEYLDDEDIKKFFGSEEQFGKLVEQGVAE